MMKLMRAIVRLILFLTVTLFLYAIVMLCFIGSVIGVNYEKYRGYLLKTWGCISCVILGIKLNVENPPPDPPFLLVSNHLSYLDVFVLFSQLRCLFVAKSDVKAWPLAGFIIRTVGILFIDRNRKRDVTRVNRLISKNITPNQGIILFAEGTTSPGIEILPLKTSLLNYPASTNFPVMHVTLSYKTGKEDPPAYTDVCWWQDIPFPVHFWDFLKIKETKAKLVFSKQGIMHEDRKLLAEELHAAMSQNLEPVITEQAFNAQHSDYKSALPV